MCPGRQTAVREGVGRLIRDEQDGGGGVRLGHQAEDVDPLILDDRGVEDNQIDPSVAALLKGRCDPGEFVRLTPVVKDDLERAAHGLISMNDEDAGRAG